MAYTQFVSPQKPVFHTRTGRTISLAEQAVVPPDVSLSQSSFKASRLEVSMTADLNFNFGSLQGKSDASLFVLQFSFYDPDLYIAEYAGEEVGQVFGSALRIGVLTWGTSASASMNLSMIAASASVNSMSTQMQVETIGMNHSLSTKINSLITSSTFNADAMEQIGAAISSLQLSVKENPDLLEPDLIEYGDLISPANADYLQGVSAAYAIHSITHDRTLNSALDRLNNKVSGHDRDYYYPLVNPMLTEAVYYQISGGNPWGSLSSDTKKKAHQIYDNTKAK